MPDIATNIAAIRTQIEAACNAAGRNPESVRLIAVSKTKPPAAIREAFDAGQIEFGESYVQEFLEKKDSPELSSLDLSWHFIGHLQSNKVRFIVGSIDLIHGIDKYSTAEACAKQAQKLGITVDYLLEVNTSGEPSKYGLHPDQLLAETEAFLALPNMRLRGLMTIASHDPADARTEFRLLAQLLHQLQQRADDPSMLTELSMGMSGDFHEAIAEGATMIRIGTALFGWR